MKVIHYKLLSGTEDNPIKVVVSASAAFATISWTYTLTIEDDSCLSCEITDNHSETVEIKPLECDEETKVIKDKLTWNNVDVFYEITQKEYECPPTCEGEPKITNTLIDNRVWVTPYDVYCNHENKEIKLHYEFYQTTEYCGQSKTKKIVKNVPLVITTDCNCSMDNTQVTSSYTSDEQLVVNYKYNCIVKKVGCDCSSFSFNGDSSSCNCDGFRFVDGSGGDCNCSFFAFIDDSDPLCQCAYFSFKDEDEGNCICNNFDFKE